MKHHSWITRGLGALAAAIAALTMAGCPGTGGPPSENSKVVALTAAQQAAIARQAVPGGQGYDPVVQQLFEAGYKPASLLEPGDVSAQVWAVQFACQAPSAGTCTGAPDVQVGLKGEPSFDTFAFDPAQVITVTRSGYNCTMPYAGFKGSLLLKLTAAVDSTLQRGQTGPVTVDGLKLDCVRTT